jgi:hypothetical protein
MRLDSADAGPSAESPSQGTLEVSFMQAIATRKTSVDRELILAKQLDHGIDALQRGEPLEVAARGRVDVASLLEVAESRFERGRPRRRLLRDERLGA